MLAVTFLFPVVLAGAAGVVAPVIIHLIMRTKPRRIIFPAMRFVKRTHQANLSKLRLKHLLLLLMRMGVILLLAVLIARPEIPRWASVEDRSVPAAVVVVVDNSGSMGYRDRGPTLLARGKQFARQVLDSLPDGSRVAILPTEGAPAKVSFQADRSQVRQQLAAVPAGYGTRPVAPTIARALSVLREVDLPRKELYVVSDLTARSWRDLGRIAGDDVRFIVLDCSGGEDANIALGEVRLDAVAVPEGAEVAVETVLRSAQVGGEFEVRAELNGRPVDSRTVELPAGGAVGSVTLTFAPRGRGIAHGRICFDQDDPLAMDNVRYFTLHVGAPVQMLIVRDPTTVGRGSGTSFLMGQAVAPGPSTARRASWIGRETITADRLDAARLRAVRIVLLADVASLTEAQWTDLGRFVQAGGHVWAVLGSLASPASYNAPAAQKILPAALGTTEVLAAPVAWRIDKRSEPMLLPFSDDANPPLSEVRCKRRFKLADLAPDAHVVLRYADGKGAIVTRVVGRGSTVLWSFSPARGYSNLAGLAQFPVLARWTAQLLAGGRGEATMCSWGQTATVPIPQSVRGAMTTVRKPGSAGEQPVAVGMHDRAVSFRADRLGPWTVRFGQGPQRVERGFSVNAGFTESDLTPADPAKLAEAFPPGRLLIARDLAGLAEARRTVMQPLDLAVPLLLALLVLLTVESFFANRFYRREPSGEEGT